MREPTQRIAICLQMSSCHFCARQCPVLRLTENVSAAICSTCMSGVLDWAEGAAEVPNGHAR